MLRKILRQRTVIERTSRSRASIRRGIRNGTFPAPVVIGKNAIGWYEDEITAWLESRPRVNYAVVGIEATA